MSDPLTDCAYCDRPKNHAVHRPAAKCVSCWAPRDHHDYQPPKLTHCPACKQKLP